MDIVRRPGSNVLYQVQSACNLEFSHRAHLSVECEAHPDSASSSESTLALYRFLRSSSSMAFQTCPDYVCHFFCGLLSTFSACSIQCKATSFQRPHPHRLRSTPSIVVAPPLAFTRPTSPDPPYAFSSSRVECSCGSLGHRWGRLGVLVRGSQHRSQTPQ